MVEIGLIKLPHSVNLSHFTVYIVYLHVYLWEGVQGGLRFTVLRQFPLWFTVLQENILLFTVLKSSGKFLLFTVLER